MEKTQSKHIVGSILCGLLTAFGIVASVIAIIGSSSGGNNGMLIFSDCAIIFLFVAIAYYAFIGYKKPHGNMLKYIILIGSTLTLTAVYTFAETGEAWMVIVMVIKIGLSCYIAGRLNKAKENLVLMIMVTVCIVTEFVLGGKLGTNTIGAFAPPITWLDICVAYFLRYKQHKEAGLEDAPKK